MLDFTLKLAVGKTKKGTPTFWERGGAYNGGGTAQLIATSEGLPKIPLYIKRTNQPICDNHALFAITLGDIIVITNQHHGELEINVYKVTQIHSTYVVLEMQTYYNEEIQWLEEKVAEQYEDVIRASIAKSKDFHCKTAYYYTL